MHISSILQKNCIALEFQKPCEHVQDAWSNWDYRSRYRQKRLTQIYEGRVEIWHS